MRVGSGPMLGIVAGVMMLAAAAAAALAVPSAIVMAVFGVCTIAVSVLWLDWPDR